MLIIKNGHLCRGVEPVESLALTEAPLSSRACTRLPVLALLACAAKQSNTLMGCESGLWARIWCNPEHMLAAAIHGKAHSKSRSLEVMGLLI
jgi:hypothetical protein